MKTRTMITVGILGVIFSIVLLWTIGSLTAQEISEHREIPDQNICEQMGGKWNTDHCLVTQEIIDSNQLTCDPGPVLGNGYCNSNGIKLVIKSPTEPEPEPEPMPDSESLQRQKQQQAKLHVQEVIMTDFRGHEYDVSAINEYRNEFEDGYFLEQFIISNKQNYEKDELINFVFVEWRYQSQECTSPKVEMYLRPYENYDSIEKINEWQKSEEECYSIDSDSDGYLIANVWHIGLFELSETCTIPGEYRVVASNLKDESKKEYGYYTCQKEKLVGEPQPWMEIPE